MFEELVKIENDQAVTTSLKVAEYFDKQHSHVLDTIKSILAVENSATKFFFESTYENRGKQYPQYLMNRDGFSLLVMGFTGAKALKWKIKFIEAFNAMEQKLKYGSDRPPVDYLEALKQLVKKEEERRALEASYRAEQERADNAEREAKANQDARDLQDQATKRRIGYDLGKAAKFLNVKDLGRNRLFKFLRDNGDFFYDRNGYNTVKQSHVNQKRFFEYIDETYEYPVIYITPKGMRYVLKALINAGYKPQITAEEWERKCQLDQEEEEE